MQANVDALRRALPKMGRSLGQACLHCPGTCVVQVIFYCILSACEMKASFPPKELFPSQDALAVLNHELRCCSQLQIALDPRMYASLTKELGWMALHGTAGGNNSPLPFLFRGKPSEPAPHRWHPPPPQRPSARHRTDTVVLTQASNASRRAAGAPPEPQRRWGAGVGAAQHGVACDAREATDREHLFLSRGCARSLPASFH